MTTNCKNFGPTKVGVVGPLLLALPIYSKAEKEYREESYISAVEYYKYRSAITRFRISAHNLPLKKGRWEGVNKTECKCKKCINNDGWDEKHCILHCNAPDVVKLKAMFFKDNKLNGSVCI